MFEYCEARHLASSCETPGSIAGICEKAAIDVMNMNMAIFKNIEYWFASEQPRDLSAHSRDLSTHSRDLSTHSRDLSTHSRDRSAHSRDLSTHSRDLSAPPGGFCA